MKSTSLALLLSLALASGAAAEPVPAEFLHDQVWLMPKVEGQTLRFFTDTGGGFNAISQAVAERLGLVAETVEVDGRPMQLTGFPDFDAGHALPAAPEYFMDGRLAVVDAGMFPVKGDGFLGGRWFADGIWSFDYPAGRLERLDAYAAPEAAGTPAPLGFQTNAAGQRTMHFPSMDITVDGEVLPVLLDTGATATLGEDAAAMHGLPVGTDVGTSFIEREVFERWVAKHPDWRVAERGDAMAQGSFRMIEVPQVEIAGHVVGPVWFAERPPGAFQKYMASMMDRPTWGAIGGSGLKYFHMVIDYPAAQAWFTPVATPAGNGATAGR
jgi:hypothetical protein